MILLFDLGNSRCKWCVWEAGAPRSQGAEPYTSDGTLPRELFAALETMGIDRPDAVMACAVAAPTVLSELEQWVEHRFRQPLRRFVTRRSHDGIINAYPNPDSLGADRWAAILGARSRYQGALFIVDCGTAVTVDVLQQDDRHAGGLIFPGLALSRRALTSGAHQLADPGDGALPLLAIDTPTAIRAGTFHSLAAAVQGLRRRAEATLGTPLTGILTGGDAEALAEVLDGDWQLDHDVVFAGLAQEVVGA